MICCIQVMMRDSHSSIGNSSKGRVFFYRRTHQSSLLSKKIPASPASSPDEIPARPASCPYIFCNVQPQFSGECGVHAIANAVEYCFNQFTGMSDVQFDRKKLRSHCLTCLESGKFSLFPEKGRERSKLTNKKIKSITLIAHCSCRMPEIHWVTKFTG